jgi:hypothetical protein
MVTSVLLHSTVFRSYFGTYRPNIWSTLPQHPLAGKLPRRARARLRGLRAGRGTTLPVPAAARTDAGVLTPGRSYSDHSVNASPEPDARAAYNVKTWKESGARRRFSTAAAQCSSSRGARTCVSPRRPRSSRHVWPAQGFPLRHGSGPQPWRVSRGHTSPATPRRCRPRSKPPAVHA